MSEESISVRKEVVVEAPQERAFRVFTEGFNAWWPREHHLGQSPLRAAIIEPRAGGRWYEVDEDGSECDWGRVLLWSPPARIVLGWSLDATWKYDPALVTEVEVRFHAEGPKRTRVELEHRNLERFGAALDATRAALDSKSGWGGIIELYAAAANAPAT